MSSTAYETLQKTANIGRFRLSPSALSFHPDGPAAHDDPWVLTVGEDGTVELRNCVTAHFWRLTPSDVVSVVPDSSAPKDGLTHFRVTLRGQLGLQGPLAGWLRRPHPWQRTAFRPRTA